MLYLFNRRFNWEELTVQSDKTKCAVVWCPAENTDEQAFTDFLDDLDTDAVIQGWFSDRWYKNYRTTILLNKDGTYDVNLEYVTSVYPGITY